MKEEILKDLELADKELLIIAEKNLFDFAKYDSIHQKIYNAIQFLESE